MTEETQSIWRKAWPGFRGLALWIFLLAVATFAAIFVIGLLSGLEQAPTMALIALSGAAVLTLVGVALALFLRWLGLGHNLRRFSFGIVCLVTLVALFYAEENWRGKWAWERFQRTWEAKGEHFKLSEIAPPPVPDAENFAMAPIVVTAYGQLLDRNGHRIIPPDTNVVNQLDWPISIYSSEPTAPGLGYWPKSLRADLQAWQQYYQETSRKTNFFPVPTQSQSPANDVLFALSKYDQGIEALRQAGNRPYSRFPLEYDTDNPPALLLPHLAKIKTAAQVLELRALAEIQSGQAENALSDILLIFRLQEAMDAEPFLITHLVRLAIVNLALQPVWEGLTDKLWSDAQLATLEAALRKVDCLEAYRTSMRGELACTSGTIDYLRRTRRISDILGDSDSWVVVALRWAPAGWFYQNQLRCAQLTLDQYLPVVDFNQRTVSPDKTREAAAMVDRAVQHKDPYDWILSYVSPALSQAVKKFAWAQNAVDLAQVACALERYRLAQGHYPDNLDILTPKFISRLPRDVIGGKPLRYQSTADGKFLLYSIGWNETDDGGKMVLSKGGDRIDLDQGDWVWPH